MTEVRAQLLECASHLLSHLHIENNKKQWKNSIKLIQWCYMCNYTSCFSTVQHGITHSRHACTLWCFSSETSLVALSRLHLFAGGYPAIPIRNYQSLGCTNPSSNPTERQERMALTTRATALESQEGIRRERCA